MATRSCAFLKKGCLLARDTLGLNRAKPVARARLRQIKSAVAPLSDFHSLQYANNVRQTLTVKRLQTLTLPRNQRINPQARSALKAV
jgi:TolA-binding protein